MLRMECLLYRNFAHCKPYFDLFWIYKLQISKNFYCKTPPTCYKTADETGFG